MDKTYDEQLSVCRAAQRKMRNGSLTQGGKKLCSLGMFGEAGRDLFEGTSSERIRFVPVPFYFLFPCAEAYRPL